MSRLLLILHFFCLPWLAVSQPQSLTCQIASDKEVYQVSETPVIKIEIKNNTDSTIQLVKVLDGSEQQMRFPYVYYEVYKVTGLSRQKVAPPRVIRCGNMDGIQVDDFVSVKSGQTFNPLANQDIVYTSGVSLSGWLRRTI